jgi:hypothetical protein
MGPASRTAAAFLNSLQGADWTFFAGRPFHFTYQSWTLKSLLLADMPSLFVQVFGGLLLWPVRCMVHVDIYEGSYVSAGFLFVIGTVQWLLVGRFFQKRFQRQSV